MWLDPCHHTYAWLAVKSQLTNKHHWKSAVNTAGKNSHPVLPRQAEYYTEYYITRRCWIKCFSSLFQTATQNSHFHRARGLLPLLLRNWTEQPLLTRSSSLSLQRSIIWNPQRACTLRHRMAFTFICPLTPMKRKKITKKAEPRAFLSPGGLWHWHARISLFHPPSMIGNLYLLFIFILLSNRGQSTGNEWMQRNGGNTQNIVIIKDIFVLVKWNYGVVCVVECL